MSRTHNVIKGDTLWEISRKYYGTPRKWQDIVKANPQLSDDQIIYPGQVLMIPDEIENIINPTQSKEPPATIQSNSDDSISILIDNNLFSFFTEYSITFDIDTFDTFSFSAPFDDSLKIYRDSFRPFSYKSIIVYYGKNLIFTGILLAPESSTFPDKKELSITGYSKPGILNDSMMPISSFPLEFNNQTLEQITTVCLKPYGIKYNFLSSSGNPFEKISLEIENNIFSFLSELAKQRGLLISNDEFGKLIFWQPSSNNPVASFKEEELPLISVEPMFDYQKFYSHITGIKPTTEEKDSVKYTYENKYLINQGILRAYNFVLEDIEDGEIRQAVISKAGRMFSESAQYKLTVQGHMDRNGDLYKKNTAITLLSPSAMIYSETKFLIKSLRLSRNNSGDTTEFSLVLPGIYNGSLPEVFPWEE